MFPFKFGRCGIPSRLSFGGKRTRATINRASHHHSWGTDLFTDNSGLPSTTSKSSPQEPFHHCTSSSIAHLEAIHHKVGVGYYTARWTKPG